MIKLGFMRRLCIVILLAAIVAPGCSRQAEPVAQASFLYDQQIGLANVHTIEGCLASASSSISPGTRVTLVDQPAQGLAFDMPTVAEATIEEHVEDCDSRHMLSMELSASGPTYYRLRLDSEWRGNDYVFAIIRSVGVVAAKGNNVEGDLDGDGTKESFRMCLSNEGAHYQVWTGEPLTGTPRWHWYVYAGYSTDRNCTEKDYFGPK
jgi:hypothetical protein